MAELSDETIGRLRSDSVYWDTVRILADSELPKVAKRAVTLIQEKGLDSDDTARAIFGVLATGFVVADLLRGLRDRYGLQVGELNPLVQAEAHRMAQTREAILGD